jgi:hypothetical protein
LTDRQAVDAFNAVLAKQYTGLKLAVDAGALAVASPAPPQSLAGVYYRPVSPVKVTLTQDRQVTEQILLLPNQGALITLPITRNAFVKKVTKIEFEHGLLKKVTLNKPSEVRGAVSLPIEIGKALVAIPAELIQLKINRAEDEQTLLAAEKRRLAAEEQLQALRRELQQARDNPLE